MESDFEKIKFNKLFDTDNIVAKGAIVKTHSMKLSGKLPNPHNVSIGFLKFGEQLKVSTISQNRVL